MKRLVTLLKVSFGVFLGLTFPEQITSAIDYLQGVDYAGLFEATNGILDSVGTFLVDSFEYIKGLFAEQAA